MKNYKIVDKLIIFSFFIMTSIPTSGIDKFTNYSCYNLSGILLFLFVFTLKEIKINKLFLVYILCIILNLIFNFEKSGILLLTSLSPLFYNKFLMKKKKELLEKYIKIQLISLLIIFSIDFLCRFYGNYYRIYYILKSVILNDRSIENFYSYKIVNSIMFADSNYTAIIIGIAILYCIHLEQIKIKGIKKYKYIFIFFFIFTFSRAAYLSFIIAILYRKYFYLKKNIKRIIKVGFFLQSILLFPIIVNFFSKDKSILIRFKIINKFLYKIIELNILQLLFGVGFTNSTDYLGKYGHNFIVVMLLEGGSILFLVMILCFLLLWIRYKKFKDILIFFIGCIMSVTQYNYIFLFVVLVILKVISEVKYDKCYNGNL